MKLAWNAGVFFGRARELRVQRVPWTPSLIFSLREIGESRNYNSWGRHWDERRRCGRGRRKYLTRGNVCSAGYVESTIHEQNYRVSTLLLAVFFPFRMNFVLKTQMRQQKMLDKCNTPGKKPWERGWSQYGTVFWSRSKLAARVLSQNT